MIKQPAHHLFPPEIYAITPHQRLIATTLTLPFCLKDDRTVNMVGHAYDVDV